MDWPRFEHLAAPAIDQGIEGTLEYQVLANYRQFAERAQAWTGTPPRIVERFAATQTLLDENFRSSIDTLIVISLDGWRARQSAKPQEIAAVKAFLANPDHSVFVCPHHDIGNSTASRPKIR